eukprot:SAG11_NODE_9801_length_879_cov_12.028205_2_plen_163_part_01
MYLNTDAFTDNRFDKAGVRNKHYKSPGAGPYEASQIFEDKIHFSLVLPYLLWLLHSCLRDRSLTMSKFLVYRGWPQVFVARGRMRSLRPLRNMSSPPRDFLSLGLSLAVTVHFGIPLGLGLFFFVFFVSFFLKWLCRFSHYDFQLASSCQITCRHHARPAHGI